MDGFFLFVLFVFKNLQNFIVFFTRIYIPCLPIIIIISSLHFRVKFNLEFRHLAGIKHRICNVDLECFFFILKMITVQRYLFIRYDETSTIWLSFIPHYWAYDIPCLSEKNIISQPILIFDWSSFNCIIKIIMIPTLSYNRKV